MTDTPFSYEEYEEARAKLIADVNAMMTAEDKDFLVSFEMGEPDWDSFDFPYFKDYPSVQWKLNNLLKLKRQNPLKLREEAERLRKIFRLD